MFKFLKSSYQKVKNALSKTRSVLGDRLKALFGKPLDDATFDQLEQILYEADLGTACSTDFVEHTRQFVRKHPEASFQEIISNLSQRALEILSKPPPTPVQGHPHVILVVGVNGSGKTTTIAKLSERFQKEGKSIILAAGDTFRAAAIEQLELWANRLGIPIVKSKPGGDPSAVAFDALSSAIARNIDIVIIDTAGRLQNKTDLMHELEKIRRTCQKLMPEAPHETLLVLDATTGQNAIDQARTFNQFTPLTGIVLTKLDGSAKGGIVISIYKEINVPVRWIGVGEKAEDLMPFDPETYVKALFETEDE